MYWLGHTLGNIKFYNLLLSRHISLHIPIVVGSTLSVVLLIKENKKVSKKTLQRSRLIVRNLKFEVSKYC